MIDYTNSSIAQGSSLVTDNQTLVPILHQKSEYFQPDDVRDRSIEQIKYKGKKFNKNSRLQQILTSEPDEEGKHTDHNYNQENFG